MEVDEKARQSLRFHLIMRADYRGEAEGEEGFLCNSGFVASDVKQNHSFISQATTNPRPRISKVLRRLADI
jgi:hypothetical protein